MSETDEYAGLTALLGEAASKSSVLWVRPTPERAWPAWYVWREPSAYVVSGPGEQQLPPLDGTVDLIFRSKDTWARLLTLRATATTIGPDDPDWLEVAGALKAARLNAPDPELLLARWGFANTISRLSPSGGVVESPGAYDESSGAAAPAPTEATTSTWTPWHVGGRRATRRNARRMARRGRE